MLPALQYYMPQHALSRFGGWLANCQIPWLKNYLIRYFLHRYPVKLHEAQEPNPYAYTSFNSFFTRSLQPEVRPLAMGSNVVSSPADGVISQLGNICDGRLIQAKGHHFNVDSLLGGDESLASTFHEGHFMTVYLAPQDYHRVHMPIDGHLSKMIYVPGKLFSVSTRTANEIPNLFARNERVISVFKTPIGNVALILVGAMIVGSIETVWSGTLIPQWLGRRTREIKTWNYESPIFLKRGEEMGRFKLGSTVIVLLEKETMDWHREFTEGQPLYMGQSLGHYRSQTAI